jgi:hypothetical protein
MPFGGVIVNRVTDQELLHAGDDVEDDLTALLGAKLARKVARNFEDYRELAIRDHDSIERLRHETGEPVILVPHLDDDVHDLDGLAAMNEHLFAEDSVRV